MKPFKEFLNEAEPTMSANVAGEPTGNPPTNSGFGANATASGPVAGFDKFFFPNINDDLLAQGYQTPAEPGLNKWRFSNIYPVMKLELDKASEGPSIDQMVDASKEFVNIEAERTARAMRRTYQQFQGLREDHMHKTCPAGSYYCYQDKKCKKIPHGYHIGSRGWLEKDEDEGEKKNGSNNGNGNGNGHSSNGNGGNGNGNGGGVSEGVRSLSLNLEVPQTQTEFNLGLMFRESLDYDSGMLFIFDEVSQKSFHMKDTRISLDIAFIKEDGIIESIKELDPYTLQPVYSDGDVLYALEVNRGWFAENNVFEGDQILTLKK